MAEKAKWKDYDERYSALRGLEMLGGFSLSASASKSWVDGKWYAVVLSNSGQAVFDTREDAKRYAEGELRRVLTEALERLPQEA